MLDDCISAPMNTYNSTDQISFLFIDVGEELTIDYSTYTNTPPNFECWCGAVQCRRQIRPDEYKEKWFQDRYGSHINPYMLMLVEKDKIKTEYSVDRQTS
jgi:hypothetical protein